MLATARVRTPAPVLVCVSAQEKEIKLRYQLQPALHFSLPLLNHLSHLILTAFLSSSSSLPSPCPPAVRQYSLGTPETSLRGLRTLKALRALTSKPAALPPMAVSASPLVACSRMALNNLQTGSRESSSCCGVVV